MKFHYVKYHRVRVTENLKIRNVTNGIRDDLSPSRVRFKDELGGSWWACSTSIVSHQNERDLEVV